MTDRERIDDKSIKLAILKGASGDMNKRLFDPAELRKAKRVVADDIRAGLTPKEALQSLAEKVRNARSWRGRRLEDWSDLD
jgi:uncharacterized protein with von Willebrand factor type A (vWA) domain